MVPKTTSKPITPIQIGNNSGDTRIINSEMSRTTSDLRFIKTKMLKDKSFGQDQEPTVETRNGPLSTLIQSRADAPRDLIINSDSISIDHSSLCLDYQ